MDAPKTRFRPSAPKSNYTDFLPTFSSLEKVGGALSMMVIEIAFLIAHHNLMRIPEKVGGALLVMLNETVFLIARHN